MVKTPHFHDRGCGFNLRSGNQDPTCRAVHKVNKRMYVCMYVCVWCMMELKINK